MTHKKNQYPVTSPLQAVAHAIVQMFTEFDRFVSGDQQESLQRRTEKAKQLYRAAEDASDSSVVLSYRYDTKTGILSAYLNVEGDSGSHEAFISSNGVYDCDCQDRQHHGVFCKHLRALAGLVVAGIEGSTGPDEF